MAERIRVLRIIARMNVGGPALQVTNLARSLDPERFDHRLLTGTTAEDEADYVDLRAPDLPRTVVPGLGRAPRPLDDLRALAAIVAEIRAFQPHVVHTHTAKAGVLGRVAARLCRVPVVVHTFHGHLLHGYFSPAKTKALIAVERALAGQTDRLCAVGTRVRDDLVAAGVGRAEKFTVVAPGVVVPEPPPTPVARASLRLPDGVPVVAFVARLTGVKRPDRFAEAVLSLDSQVADLHVLVAGEGAALPDLRRRLAPLGARARFLGWRPDVEVVYAAADLVLLTSDNEGMPVSLIEAALCGTPAVATDVGSVREVVPDGHGLVVPCDAGAVADAAAALLRDRAALAAAGRAAQDRATTAFSVERLVADHETIYGELLASRHHGRVVR